MSADTIFGLLEEVTKDAGTTDVTIKSNGTVAVSKNKMLTVTKIDALSNVWAQEIAALFPDRSKDDLNGHTIVAKRGARRYRMTVSPNREGEALSVRPLPSGIMSPEELRLPDGLKEYFLRLNGGMFLIGGVTGSGKTWTQASLLRARAQEVGGKIITIERPIEFVHEDTDRTVFQQREVGTSATSYSRALEDALHENPSVIMVQEIRRTDEAETALSAALSGHLMIASMHAYTAATTPQRFLSIINPRAEDSGARDALASCLEGVVLQRLVPGADGLVPIFEVMLFRNSNGDRLTQMERLIREGKWLNLRQEIEVSKRHGMMLWDDSIAERRLSGLLR
jgi:twitching motility protein PilT